jgi:hypothetical protein
MQLSVNFNSKYLTSVMILLFPRISKTHSYYYTVNKQIDLQERIKYANKTYFMLQKFFKNKNISKKLKLRLKNTIIDKTLHMHQKPGY